MGRAEPTPAPTGDAFVPTGRQGLAVASEFAAECIDETLSGHAGAAEQVRVRVVVRVDLIWQLSCDRIGNFGSVGAANDRKRLGFRVNSHGSSLSQSWARSPNYCVNQLAGPATLPLSALGQPCRARAWLVAHSSA
jgi:hypothetical protein